METAAIKALVHPINARVCVPGSKSITNRALLIAALANGQTVLQNALFSDDSRIFAGALSTLGFEISMNEEEKTIKVTGLGGKIPSNKAEIFVGNAGTAARFLSAFLTLAHGNYKLDGEPRMRERPIGDLIESLSRLGVDIKGTVNPATNLVCPPVTISSNGLAGGRTQVSGEVSSQYLSALLMVAPYARKRFEIEVVNDLNSKPYVDMTERVMLDFGVTIVRQGYEEFMVDKAIYQTVGKYDIESDASAASYFFALPAVTGGKILVENISMDSMQGDIHFLDILNKMGLVVSEIGNDIEVTFDQKTTILHGVDVNMAHIPDTAQTLAAIAPFACSPTVISGIASARLKETDRISATCNELRALGVTVDEFKDGMKIYPCTDFTPAKIKTYKDHRMAMAFSLVGTKVEGVVIEDPGCVSKTFPNFFEVLDGVC